MTTECTRERVIGPTRSMPLKSILRDSCRSLDGDAPTIEIEMGRNSTKDRRAGFRRSVSFSGDKQGRWQENDTPNPKIHCTKALRMPVRSQHDTAIVASNQAGGRRCNRRPLRKADSFDETSSHRRSQGLRKPVRRAGSFDDKAPRMPCRRRCKVTTTPENPIVDSISKDPSHTKMSAPTSPPVRVLVHLTLAFN